MDFYHLFADYALVTILTLVFFSFLAGFIDAVVGGGGLIQLPALLINMPNTPLLSLFGTNKIASLSGTAVAAVSYSRRVKFNYPLLFIISFFSFIASFSGAKLIGYINVHTLKPLILVILIAMAIFTFLKKDLGSVHTKSLPLKKQMIYGSLIGIVVGFYDGFFGPGTGSFFVLGFVVVLGFEFLMASAYTKVVNCMTNISALIVFIRQGNYLLEMAVIMAISNMAGNIIGSRMALKRGNGFIRIIFLVIVTLMILRYGYDIFVKR
jgi:uncharacterized membrane protein YfcA